MTMASSALFVPGGSRRASSPWGYVLALLGVAVATAIVLGIPLLIQRGALGIYLAAIALVTWFCGWRPGVVAIALSTFIFAWKILPPDDVLLPVTPEDWARLGTFVGVSAMITLLHASRERAQRVAWETEERLAFALKVAGMGAWYSDLKTGKFWWSEEMERLFGRPPGEFSGTYEGFIGYIHPEDQDFVKRAITRTVEGGREFEIEHRIVRPDGKTGWIVTRGRIIETSDGVARQIIGIAADVTARKAATPPGNAL